MSSPVPFSETCDKNVSATTVTVNRGSWGFPSAYLRQNTRSVLDPSSRTLCQRRQQSTTPQQQVLGAWEHEKGVEEMDEARNVDNDGRSVSILDMGWGSDPDGESEVWGVGAWIVPQICMIPHLPIEVRKDRCFSGSGF